MIITISGLPGSGKSTVGKLLAEKLGYKFYSVGDLRGKMAMEKGMTIDELNELGKKEEWTDKDADGYQRKLAEQEDNFVIDGRLSFYFIPRSFKVFLEVNSRVGAERVFKRQRPDEKHVDSVAEMEQRMIERVINDALRYKKYYGIKYPDKDMFDLVIDTTLLTPDEIAGKIIKICQNQIHDS